MITFTLTILMGFNNTLIMKNKITALPKLQYENYVQFFANGPMETVHVIYELLPNKFSFEFDVVLCGSVAQIVWADGVKTFATYTADNGLVWTTITIQHTLNSLTTEEIIMLKDHNVIIHFSVDKSQAKPGIQICDDFVPYYSLRPDADENFCEVFSEKPSTSDNLLMHEIRDIIFECISRPIKNEIVTKISEMRNNLHCYTVHETIKQYNEILYKNDDGTFTDILTDSNTGKGSQKSSKKSSKSEKKTKKKSKKNSPKTPKNSQFNKYMIRYSGETFFTDSDLLKQQLSTNEKSVLLPVITVCSTVENLLNTQQILDMMPLVFKIIKLDNIPHEILLQKGFQAVCVKCDVPGLFQFTTDALPIQKSIPFKDFRCIFCNNYSKLKLLEFFQTGRLHLQVIGVKEADIEVQTPITSARHKKPKKSKKKGKPPPPPPPTSPISARDNKILEKIAIACFDVTSLLKSNRFFTEKANCHCPNTLLYEEYLRGQIPQFADRMTIIEINAMRNYELQTSSKLHISEEILLTYGTTLKIALNFFSTPVGILQALRFPNTFIRFMVIVNDDDVAKEIMTAIFRQNVKVKGAEIFLPQYLQHLRRSDQFINTASSIHKPNEDDQISGFLVDNGNSYIFFMEGLSNGYIRSLYQLVNRCAENVAKVFYNSDFVFENRLYADMNQFGGFYVITLCVQLQELYAKQETYIPGYIPLPCWRALMKINLLLKSTSLKKILQYNLIPDVRELLSLSIELGNSMRLKYEDLNDETTKKQDEELNSTECSQWLRTWT